VEAVSSFEATFVLGQPTPYAFHALSDGWSYSWDGGQPPPVVRLTGPAGDIAVVSATCDLDGVCVADVVDLEGVLDPGTYTLSALGTGYGDPGGGPAPPPATASGGEWAARLTIPGSPPQVPSLSGVGLALLVGSIGVVGAGGSRRPA
jgi:hypothetical protein